MQVYQMILKYQALKEKSEKNRTESNVDINDVLEDLSNLDPFESYIPKVPKFVIDWYYDVQPDFYPSLDMLVQNSARNQYMPICEWYMKTPDSLRILINIHQFGYHRGETERYIVKAKGLIHSEVYIGYNKICKAWVLTTSKNSEIYRIRHTKEELDNSGFDELLSDPLWNIEEA